MWGTAECLPSRTAFLLPIIPLLMCSLCRAVSMRMMAYPHEKAEKQSENGSVSNSGWGRAQRLALSWQGFRPARGLPPAGDHFVLAEC